MGEVKKFEIPVVAPEFQVANSSGITRTKKEGTFTREIAVATYDFAVDGGVVGAIPLGVYIPDNAVITEVWYDVVTTVTTASADAGTLAIHIQSANDVVAAIAVSDASNVWDAGVRGTKIGSYATSGNAETALVQAASLAASRLKTTAIREVTLTIGGQAVTAGKINIYVEYAISD